MSTQINMSFGSTLADAPPFPFNSSLASLSCLTFRTSQLLFTAFSLTHILIILPIITLVLYLGYQQWRQQRYNSAAAASHSDIFTYHMVAIEMVAVLGCLFYCVGVNTNRPKMFTCGFYLFSSTWCAKIFFHTLTCVERYLAVVYPVTYLALKNTGGIRIRNISIGCAWLLCFLWWMLMSQIHVRVRMVIFFCHVVLILISVCFCCICVLWALRRPSPGKVGRGKERVDPTKQRAFNTVVTIIGVLWLCLGGVLVCNALVESQMLSNTDTCIVRASANWFSLPSSLVLPVLYLQRAGKLPGCRH